MAVSVTLKDPKGYPPKPAPILAVEKRKRWTTPHGFADFGEPVTYAEACAAMADVAAKMFGEKP